MHEGQFLAYEPTQDLVFFYRPQKAANGKPTTLQVLNLSTGIEVGRFVEWRPAYAGGFRDLLRISPDGSRITTVHHSEIIPKRPAAGENPEPRKKVSTITHWSCPELKIIGEPETLTGTITEFEFSPDGLNFARVLWDDPTYGGNGSRTLAVQNVSDGRTRFSVDVTDSAGTPTYSPDGQRLAIACYGVVRAWFTHSGTPITPYLTPRIFQTGGDGIKRAANPITYSPDGRHLAVTDGSSVVIWPSTGGYSHRQSQPVGSQFVLLAVSHDGRLSACVAQGGSQVGVQIFDNDSARLIKTLPCDIGASISFHPKGERLIFSRSKMAKNQPKDKEKLTFEGVIVNTRTWEEMTVIPDCQYGAYSPDGRWLTTASTVESDKPTDSFVTIRDALSSASVHRLALRRANHILRFSYSADGSRLLIMNMFGVATVWETETGKRLCIVDGVGEETQTTASLSPDGQTLVIQTSSHVKFYHAATGALLHQMLLVASVGVGYVNFTPDGTYLITHEETGREAIQVWDIRTKTRLLSIPHYHKLGIQDLVFSGDRTRMITSGVDGTITIHDLTPRTKTTVLAESPAHQTVTNRLAGEFALHELPTHFTLSPDREHFAFALIDHTVRVWSCVTGKEVFVVRGHTDAVVHLQYDSEGKKLATCSRDGTVRLWNARTGQELYTWPLARVTQATRLLFSPNGE